MSSDEAKAQYAALVRLLQSGGSAEVDNFVATHLLHLRALLTSSNELVIWRDAAREKVYMFLFEGEGQVR